MLSAKVRVAAKRFLGKIGLEIGRTKYATTTETVSSRLLSLVRPDVVLDVGANTGQYAEGIRRLGFRGRIVSFEPLPDAHGILTTRASADANWHIAAQLALGSQVGTATMNISVNSVSSSLLPMLDSHVYAAPESRYSGAIPVRVDRLDAQVVSLVSPDASLWLKIDTQGFEKEVLLGATNALSRVVVVQVELSLIPLYDGGPVFSEMVAFIESLGFEMFSLVPGFIDARTGRLLQVDGFFVRRGAPFVTEHSSASS